MKAKKQTREVVEGLMKPSQEPVMLEQVSFILSVMGGVANVKASETVAIMLDVEMNRVTVTDVVKSIEYDVPLSNVRCYSRIRKG